MVPHETATAAGASFTPGRERTARPLGPGALARIASRLRSSSLDRALIAGVDATASAALAARARSLTSRRTRAHVAEGLERSLQVARGPQRRWSAASPRSPMLGNATAIGELVELLRDDAPLNAAGIAILNELLTDGSGPAYTGQPHAVARRLREARAAMVG